MIVNLDSVPWTLTDNSGQLVLAEKYADARLGLLWTLDHRNRSDLLFDLTIILPGVTARGRTRRC